MVKSPKQFQKVLETTKSVCPACFIKNKKVRVIPAKIGVDDKNIVRMVKSCPKHGTFSDIISRDLGWYEKHQKWKADGTCAQQACGDFKACPVGCGLLCPGHKTIPSLVNIDLTNRCNLRCYYCFANSAASGYVYEPTFEQVEEMVDMVANIKPHAPASIQFSGGEPTLRDDLPEIIKMTRAKGIPQIQIATNGIRIAKDVEFAKKIADAGLDTAYLKFDGLTPETNIANLQYLDAILKNARATGLQFILVPTVMQRNRHEIGKIIKFAMKNIDVVRGVNFQPVSFSGRMSVKDLEKERYTTYDLLCDIEAQTGLKKENFYPPSFVMPLSNLFEKWSGESKIKFSMHPSCGAATFAYVDKEKLIGITEFVDVEGFFAFIDNCAENFTKGFFKKFRTGLRLITNYKKYINKQKAPALFVKNMKKLFYGSHKGLGDFIKGNMLYIGAMHFQDVYDLDLERLQRCGVSYATPDKKLIPFCTYNVLNVRQDVERKFARPN